MARHRTTRSPDTRLVKPHPQLAAFPGGRTADVRAAAAINARRPPNGSCSSSPCRLRSSRASLIGVLATVGCTYALGLLELFSIRFVDAAGTPSAPRPASASCTSSSCSTARHDPRAAQQGRPATGSCAGAVTPSKASFHRPGAPLPRVRRAILTPGARCSARLKTSRHRRPRLRHRPAAGESQSAAGLHRAAPNPRPGGSEQSPVPTRADRVFKRFLNSPISRPINARLFSAAAHQANRKHAVVSTLVVLGAVIPGLCFGWLCGFVAALAVGLALGNFRASGRSSSCRRSSSPASALWYCSRTRTRTA